jgi:hypothetical protein
MLTSERSTLTFTHRFRRASYCLGMGALFSLLGQPSSFAFNPRYHLGGETDFSRQEVTPAVFPFVRFGIEAESSETEYEDEYEYKIDAEFKISPNHPKAYALSSQNLYYGERDQSYESPLRFSYGRRLVGWSGLDEMWGLGAFEPNDSWDRLRSTSQGLTGIFGYTETQKFNFRFFLSYLFLPELTPNTVIENNRFSYEHPQATSSGPQTINLGNRLVPLGYQLEIPSLTKIIFRPSFAFMMETKREIPFHAKFAYGYLPLNYFPIALDATLYSTQAIVTLHPRLLQHHVYNGELAYRFSNSISSGFTALVDQPVSEPLATNYSYTPLTSSYSWSPWIQYTLPSFKIILTHLWTVGGLDADVGRDADPTGQTSLFSSRLLYRNATQLSLQNEFGREDPHHPTLKIKLVREHSIKANWVASDFFYSWTPNFNTFIGGDLIYAEKTVASDRGAEFLSDMRTIDRIRVGATYVF